MSENSVSFLDVTIFKGKQFLEKGRLDTKVFFKPTDTHELLHKKSYHPPHTFKGIIKSQILRFKRICSNQEDFEHACKILFSVLCTRGYSKSFLRKIKRDTIFGMNPTGGSKKCNNKRCKTCTHISETNMIYDKNNNPIPLNKNLNCQSKDVIYVIECSQCGIRYVGETTQKLKDRINQHRSDINTEQDKPVAIHFTQQCRSTQNLKVTPIEQIERKVAEKSSFRGWIRQEDELQFFQRENYWIERLGTMNPRGLNKRKEIPPPIPFILIYCDQSSEINNIIKFHYSSIVERTYPRNKAQSVCATKKKSLKDLLVHTALDQEW